jgi:hypothetical protein
MKATGERMPESAWSLSGQGLKGRLFDTERSFEEMLGFLAIHC